jgi:hypothetical protein
VDTVTEYELVLPSGEVKTVTEQDEDLWFALKVCQSGRNKGGEGISLMLRAPGGVKQLRKFPTCRLGNATETNYHMVLKGNRDQVHPEITSTN